MIVPKARVMVNFPLNRKVLEEVNLPSISITTVRKIT